MDGIPPEILSLVFQLACTDDGFTGRSLSVVSNRVRSISTQHRYNSLHVGGTKRIASFASFLRKYEVPIQYLKLDCTIPGGIRGRARSEEIVRICTNVDAIFHILAPTLQGLYLIAAAVPIRLGSFTFPLLGAFFLYDSLYSISIEWDTIHFPLLKRLDISCEKGTAIRHTIYNFTRINLPALTHFGCCSHDKKGMWSILLKYAYLGKLGGMLVLNSALGFEWLLTLDMLRVGAPGAHLLELLEVAEDLRCMEGFPPIIVRGHDTTSEHITHMKEWRYVVERGEGFLVPLT